MGRLQIKHVYPGSKQLFVESGSTRTSRTVWAGPTTTGKCSISFSVDRFFLYLRMLKFKFKSIMPPSLGNLHVRLTFGFRFVSTKSKHARGDINSILCYMAASGDSQLVSRPTNGTAARVISASEMQRWGLEQLSRSLHRIPIVPPRVVSRATPRGIPGHHPCMNQVAAIMVGTTATAVLYLCKSFTFTFCTVYICKRLSDFANNSGPRVHHMTELDWV